MHKFIEKYGLIIEELILVLLLILQVMDFFGKISSEVDYLKKVISWIALAYLLYKADLTNILFGHSHRTIDIFLIISYFMLIIKEFTAQAMIDVKNQSMLTDLYVFFMQNASAIEKTGFYTGMIMLVIISFYYAAKHEIRKPSLMHVIHEEGKPPKNPIKLFLRFFIIFFVLITFYVAVFNLAMEWVAIAIDAPLVMIAIFFYIFHSKRFNPGNMIYKLGDVGEKFYERFIELFKYKHKIFIGIAGMLVLHIATDVLIFVISYLTSFYNGYYFDQLGMQGHDSIISLLQQSIPGLSEQEKVGLGIVYFLNVSALLFILVMPVYFWYELYRDERVGFKGHWIALFAVAAVIFVSKPVFSFGQITQKNLAGVDITTSTVTITSIWQILEISAGVGIAVLILSFLIKKFLEIVMFLLLSGFFSYYIYLYFMSLSSYYIDAINVLMGTPHKLIAISLILFFIATIIFYVGGFIMFMIETIRSYFRF